MPFGWWRTIRTGSRRPSHPTTRFALAHLGAETGGRRGSCQQKIPRRPSKQLWDHFVEPRICLSNSSQSRCSISESPYRECPYETHKKRPAFHFSPLYNVLRHVPATVALRLKSACHQTCVDMELDRDDERAGDFSIFLTRTGPGAAQSGIVWGCAFCTCITEFLRSARVGTINLRNVYLNEGRMVVTFAALAQ